MHRIDGPTAAPGGFWTEGNPVGGVPATIVSDDWMNDTQENLIGILTAAGISPIKNDYTQLLAAIRGVAVGRLLNVQHFTSSGTYTPTAGTKKIRVRQCGGGGAGASVPASSSGFCAVGSGGASGSEAEAIFSSGFDSVAVTIGAGGVVVAGTAGGGGGATGFGTLLLSPGGGGGNVIQASTSSLFVAGQGLPGSNSTSSGADSVFVKAGQPGLSGISLGAASLSGQGAPSNFGSGGVNSGSGAGTAATGYGAGGSGAANQSSGSAYLGGAGSRGVIIVEEYA